MGKLLSLDYAIMDNVGGDGYHIEKTLERLGAYYNIKGKGSDYHLLLVVNSLWTIDIKDEDRIRKDLTFNLDTISRNGKWKSSLAEGWPGETNKETNIWYDSEHLKLGEDFPDWGIINAKKIIEEYAKHDAHSKRLAVVGFYNSNVDDPRKCSTLITKDNIEEYRGRHYRFATRGAKEIKIGVRVLYANAPTFSVEDYDEAHRKMAKEALDFFLRACKDIFKPRLIHSDFPPPPW